MNGSTDQMPRVVRKRVRKTQKKSWSRNGEKKERKAGTRSPAVTITAPAATAAAPANQPLVPSGSINSDNTARRQMAKAIPATNAIGGITTLLARSARWVRKLLGASRMDRIEISNDASRITVMTA